jgi:hypothetical protein
VVDSAYNRFSSPRKISHHTNISEHEYLGEETSGTDDRYGCYVRCYRQLRATQVWHIEVHLRAVSALHQAACTVHVAERP